MKTIATPFALLLAFSAWAMPASTNHTLEARLYCNQRTIQRKVAVVVGPSTCIQMVNSDFRLCGENVWDTTMECENGGLNMAVTVTKYNPEDDFWNTPPVAKWTCGLKGMPNDQTKMPVWVPGVDGGGGVLFNADDGMSVMCEIVNL